MVQSGSDDGTINTANCPGTNCRLRDAIATASAGDTITFAGDYTITLSSELVIGKDLTITGAGHSVTVSGNKVSRVLNLTAGNVTLDYLTIADGVAQTPACAGSPSEWADGGIVIQNSAVTVTVTNSTISGNMAYGGGGIYICSGTLTVINSTIFGNSAAGGGIYNDHGTLTKMGGDKQSTPINTAFPTLLAAIVSSASGEPVNGGIVTFTGPSRGASTNPIRTTATIANGAVLATATADSTVGGPYTVTASTRGATSVKFSLTNRPGQADLSITKTVALVNSNPPLLIYTIKVTNPGPTAVQQVVLQDPLPPQVKYANYTSAILDTCRYDETSRTLRCEARRLAVKETWTIRFLVRWTDGNNFAIS